MVALAPPTDPIVMKLDQFMRGMGFRTKTFDTKDAILAYTAAADYTDKVDANGLSERICMGVVLKPRDGNKWEYTMMYNATGRPDYRDYVEFGMDQTEAFKEEDEEQ